MLVSEPEPIARTSGELSDSVPWVTAVSLYSIRGVGLRGTYCSHPYARDLSDGAIVGDKVRM
jgi:hypothetical protein